MAFSDLGGDRHRDFVLIALPEIVANLLTIYAVERFAYSKHISGRKYFVQFSIIFNKLYMGLPSIFHL